MSRIVIRNSPSGYKNPTGNIVIQIQTALSDKGYDPGPLDGVFGLKSENAVEAFQGDNWLDRSGDVDLQTWMVLTGQEDLPSLFDRTIAVTASFEGHGFTFAAGNFDGAYLTWGIIGYTLRHGDLKTVINRTLTYDPNAVENAFGSKANEFIDILSASKTAQKNWGNSISIGSNKYNIQVPWRDAFKKLGENQHCRRAQLEIARERYWKRARKDYNYLEFGDELGMAMCFDIAVQNGGMNNTKKNNLKKILNETGPLVGQAYREAVAEAVASGSNPKYYKDVLSRKSTIARGRGAVHGANYRLNDWCLADLPTFDFEIEPAVLNTPSGGWNSVTGELSAATLADVLNTGDDEEDFVTFINSLGLKHFKPYEFLVKGSSHSNPGSGGYGKNTNPPRALWPKISQTARVLDILRGRLNAPIITLSVYRSPAYNKAIGGVQKSLHKQFNAIDFTCQGNSRPTDWAEALRSMRAEGLFTGGIGTYKSFVHIDTRGYNADW